MDKEVETLAKYRLEQAKENLEEAQIIEHIMLYFMQ